MKNLLQQQEKEFEERWNSGDFGGGFKKPTKSLLLSQKIELLEKVMEIVSRTIGINLNSKTEPMVYKNGIDTKEYINKWNLLSTLQETINDIKR